MTDHQLCRRTTFAGHEIDLVVTTGRVLGVGDNRHAGGLGGTRAGDDELAFVIGNLAVAGGYLDGTGLDTGLAYALFDFLDIDIDQFIKYLPAKVTVKVELAKVTKFVCPTATPVPTS